MIEKYKSYMYVSKEINQFLSIYLLTCLRYNFFILHLNKTCKYFLTSLFNIEKK